MFQPCWCPKSKAVTASELESDLCQGLRCYDVPEQEFSNHKPPRVRFSQPNRDMATRKRMEIDMIHGENRGSNVTFSIFLDLVSSPMKNLEALRVRPGPSLQKSLRFGSIFCIAWDSSEVDEHDREKSRKTRINLCHRTLNKENHQNHTVNGFPKIISPLIFHHYIPLQWSPPPFLSHLRRLQFQLHGLSFFIIFHDILSKSNGHL